MKKLPFALAILLLGLFGFFVWPTLYRYDNVVYDSGESRQEYYVRFNRVTGAAEYLHPKRGWSPLPRITRPPSGTQSPSES